MLCCQSLDLFDNTLTTEAVGVAQVSLYVTATRIFVQGEVR